MKISRYIIYFLLSIFTAISCVEERIPSGAQLADVPCVLNVDKGTISFEAQVSTADLAITSKNVSWELTGAPEWLTVSQKNGTGTAIVTITAAENVDVDNSRVAVLQLKSTTGKYEYSKNITVSQVAAIKYVYVDTPSLTLAPQSSQATVTVSSNVEWEAVCSAGWLALSKNDAAALSVTAGENTTAGSRTTTITLRRVGTTQSLATISVVQSEAGVTGSTETVFLEADGGTESVDIEADVEWTATTSATSWLTVTPTNGVGGKANLAITALANNSTVSRSGFVYVNIGTAQKLAIPVSQEGISFNVVGALENVFAADGSTKQKLTVESNTAWAVLSCPEWLTITPVQGSKGTTEITLQAAANNSLDSRSATLRIGIEGLTIYKDITVAQEGVTIELGDRSLDFGWETAEREVEITFPGSWSAMASDDWITLSQTGGLGEETIIVTAATNPGEDVRTGTITVASEGRSMKITAVQQGQYLKINSTAGEVGAMGGRVSLTVTTSVGATAVVEYEGDAKDWITFDSDDKGVYTLSVAYNPSSNNRTAQFVIKPTMSGTNTTCSSGVKFAITQKGRSLSANVNSIAISVAGGTSDTYTITADGGYAITKPDADDWYTLQQDSASCTFSIVATENTTNNVRTSRLTVSLAGLPSGETKDLVIEVLQHDLYNGHEYVDLGLSVKWAACNVGATTPEEYGGYYAWGETEEKEDYRSNVDNKTVLDLEDDVAHVKWGGSWRMPTRAELDELHNSCTRIWTTQNGVRGYKVTGPNGNSIFLPAAGFREGTGLYNSGYGYYWSSSLSGNSHYAYRLYFGSGGYFWGSDGGRYLGFSVRPVCDEAAAPDEKYTVTVNSAGNGSVAIKDAEGETSMSYEYGDNITVVATPDEGYAFSGWFVGDALVSADAEYTFTVSEDVELVARFKEKEYVEGHECIDLGLPSGLKWAAYNVGATKPEEHGGYYAWGETEEKEDYSWATYKWCNGSNTILTKYCTDSSCGAVDNKTVLDPEDDVAHVKWGGGWRMPTIADRNELLDNCTVEVSQLNGVPGYRLTSKINGNSIFLPATDRSPSYYLAMYLLTTFDSYYNSMAHILSFSTVELTGKGTTQRMLGCSVRPVFKELHSVSVSSAGNGSVAIKDTEGETSMSYEYGDDITVVATPDEGYAFDGWFIDGNEEPVSTDAEYTFTVSEDVALIAKFVVKPYLPSGSVDGYDYVDLGLPSGVKWATCNVGATKPEEHGGYYAWGETEEKEDYSTGTYKWFNGGLTKYCTNSEDGIVDNKIVLDPEDDVAHVRWGGGWRMPTITEYQELINNCIWVWTELNGVTGYCVTSEINGNCVFFPASGWRNGTEVLNEGDCGLYWQSSIVPYDSYFAVCFYMNSTYRSCSFDNNYGRHAGYNVRPVHGERPTAKYIISVNSDGNGSVAIKDAEGETSMSYEYGDNITVVATPNEGYAFSGWYVGDALVSTDAEYTFTVSEDVALIAKFVVKPYLPSGSVDGYDYVDLGLPSGLKWATCNVDASAPEEYGGYYAWGETEEKEDYSWSTYKWCNGSETTMTKYCTSSSYGTVDNKTVLNPEDDVAHVKWGGSWRMPTLDEQKELLNNCTWNWTTQNGVNGHRVTSKTNGNSIFLPAAGDRFGAEVKGRGSYGLYRSSSLDSYGSNDACFLRFNSGVYDWERSYRCVGFSVRPVCGDAAPVARYTVSVSCEVGGSVAIKEHTETTFAFEDGSTVTVVATPVEGYEFVGWFVIGSETAVSTNAEYTFTVSEDVELVAKFEKVEYEAVDLGLPSGIKWATCNVGATTPAEYGGYYAWGETEEKSNYDWNTYKWCNGSPTKLTKYCNDSYWGTVDKRTILEPEDDVAHVKWGGDWRMPTKTEFQELVNNCTWTWTTYDGVEGYMVTSKSNGNKIFLPAAGYCSGTKQYKVGLNGAYWSSLFGSQRDKDAIYLDFTNGSYKCFYGDGTYFREIGRTVRPVCE